jgi:isoleucyl-tRNA synthetase
MDYKDTLNLPKTSFQMKASLPQKEPILLKFWSDCCIYSKIKSARENCAKYTLHDGPPYANGHIHIGHALNKTLKDIVVKYKTMKGNYCEFIPGWDCHGLPVEHQLFKKLNKKKTDIEQVEFRDKAYDYAMEFVSIQKQEFERLGIFGEWEAPYLTTDKAYEASIIRSFKALAGKGYIYQGKKPVNWCYRCETALAEAEVEYDNHTSPSVYVRFKLNNPRKLQEAIKQPVKSDTYILIWTTTPWTLIANTAAAVHPDKEYVIVEENNNNIIIACGLLDTVCEKTRLGRKKVLAKFKGRDIEGLTYEHPFNLREGKIVLAEYVSMEEGSGCVHIAPGHGQDDYIIGQAYGLETIMPVDEKGRFTSEAGEFCGENVHKANEAIIAKLAGVKALLYSESINHSYPHCWRCKGPIIFRATEQWFLSIDHNRLRDKVSEAIKNIQWIPAPGQDRILSMLSTRPDWCLSRQRYWGVPIPVFLCKKCGKWVVDTKLIEFFAGIVEKKGTNAWFKSVPEELMPVGYKCPHPGCAGSEFEKGSDILDVWFESGVSHQAVLKNRPCVNYPCDLYLEGSDQHRGWFQSSLITSVAIDSKPAFKSVLTHGFVVDGAGRKMSKSLGNVISPQEIIKNYGADILRLWAAFSDYNDDIRISPQILARLIEAYRKIRNTARFMLGNIYDFNYDKDNIEYADMRDIDRWAVSRAYNLLNEITDFYETFQFHKVYHRLYSFCIVEMSNFYMDIVKDVLYTFRSDSPARRSCQSALYCILEIVTKAIAPVLVFTAEEIWQAMPKRNGMPESVHLSLVGIEKDFIHDAVLENRFSRLKAIRDDVLKVLEAKRSSGIIGSSLEAKVVLPARSKEEYNFLKENEDLLAELFIVSQVEIKNLYDTDNTPGCSESPSLDIEVHRAMGEKCLRCWNYSMSTGNFKSYPGICKKCYEALNSAKGENSQ